MQEPRLPWPSTVVEPDDVPRFAAALVFAAGELPASTVVDEVIRRCLAAGAYVVAADGGLVHAHALGVTPHLIIGDFDSAPADLVATYPAELVSRYPPAKDEMDLELAVNAALARGAVR